MKDKTELTIVVPEENTADAWKEAAIELAEKMDLHWTDTIIRKKVESHWADLKAPKDKRTDEVKAYIRKDSVGRAWISRKKLFGPSGYKAGYSPNFRRTKKAVNFTTA